MTDLDDKIIIIAKYYIKHKSTIRKTAKHFHISKTSVHAYLAYKLPSINSELYTKYSEICKHNKDIRHLLGGEAIRKMYETKRLLKGDN